MQQLLKLLLCLLGVLVLGALTLWINWNLTERQRIHSAVISSAHLAPIPDLNYKAWTQGNMFSRGYLIAFTCNDTEFQKFVSSSPGLKEIVPFFFPYSETDPSPTTLENPPDYIREAMRDAREFWRVDVNQSAEDKAFWDHTKPRKKGRSYEIHIPAGAIYGWLLRDDESGQVLLAISYS